MLPARVTTQFQESRSSPTIVPGSSPFLIQPVQIVAGSCSSSVFSLTARSMVLQQQVADVPHQDRQSLQLGIQRAVRLMQRPADNRPGDPHALVEAGVVLHQLRVYLQGNEVVPLQPLHHPAAGHDKRADSGTVSYTHLTL